MNYFNYPSFIKYKNNYLFVLKSQLGRTFWNLHPRIHSVVFSRSLLNFSSSKYKPCIPAPFLTLPKISQVHPKEFPRYKMLNSAEEKCVRNAYEPNFALNSTINNRKPQILEENCSRFF